MLFQAEIRPGSVRGYSGLRRENPSLPDFVGQCHNTSMRKFLTATLSVVAAGILLVGNALAQQTPTTAAPQSTTEGQNASTLKTQKDRASYALGMNLGVNLHKQSIDIDPALLLQGLQDGMAGGKMQLSEDEARAALTELQNDVRKKQQEKMQQAGEANKKQGAEFLAANKGKEGVVTLPSGLQYKILNAGMGPKPTASDSVVCNYRGTLVDGTEFDSSYKRGQPATFPVGGVIKGWTEALQLMPVGSKWQLFIPSELAYGERGTGADIGPNAVLVFDVELLSIQSKDSKDKDKDKDKDKE
jgi:FKBP-type peptidyl-prolyl cis-trans isomerase FklB